METKVNFWRFWKTLFLHPKNFFQTYLAEEDQQPYYWLPIGAFFMMNVLISFNKPSTSVHHMASVIGKLIGSGISYFLVGWVEKFRIWLAGGKSSTTMARNIFFYAGAVANISYIALVGIISLFTSFRTASLLATLPLLPLVCYTGYVEYCGVLTMTQANRSRAIFWFIIFPVTVILLVGLGIIVPTLLAIMDLSVLK